jgi:lipopolysaccharide export system permease protein
MRFQEIARFAASGAPIVKVLFFMLLQVPYILPLAIPVSALIASLLLFQKLSHLHELTALRSSGLGLKPIIAPLLFAGVLLSAINFVITCELSPLSRGLTKSLIYEMAATNPLFLLQKESLLKLKHVFIDMKVLKTGHYADNVVLALKNTSTDRLALVSAQKLYLNGSFLKGDNVVIISSVDSKKEDGFDHLVIENQEEMNTPASNFTQFAPHADWESSYEYLPLRWIRANERLERGSWHLGRSALLEISKRISLSLAAFTFTLIGVAFGTDISRTRSKKRIFWAIILAALYLVCFLMAKSFRHTPTISMAILLLIHPLIILLSLKSLRTIARGIE